MGADKKLLVQFGKNLRACRKRARLSQEELSFRASLHRSEISSFEAGERESHLGTVVRLASALSVSVEDLLRGSDWRSHGLGGSNLDLSGDALNE